MTRYGFPQYCRCPLCLSRLAEQDDSLECTGCGHRFAIEHGIAVLLPVYEDEGKRRRYLDNYEQIAVDDLTKPLESQRAARHEDLLDFVGRLAGRRVLDIGSSNSLYLRDSQAEFKVALDIAMPYLEAIGERADFGRVRADAEALPFVKGFFDTVIISDVLEHVLDANQVMTCLRRICTPQTRVVIHVPWEEDLSQYRDQPYEFTHVRRFDDYSFADIAKDFRVVRSRGSIPNLDIPVRFRLRNRIPGWIFNRLSATYFFGDGDAKRDLEWRVRMRARRPKDQRWLLWVCPPVYKMFELRLRPDRELPDPVDEPRRLAIVTSEPPERDARVSWLTSTCASIGPTHVIAYDLTPAMPIVTHGRWSWMERVHDQELPQALRRELLAKPPPEASTPAESSHSGNFRSRLMFAWGAAKRASAATRYRRAVAEALHRRLRSIPIQPRVVICHGMEALDAAFMSRGDKNYKVVYDARSNGDHRVEAKPSLATWRADRRARSLLRKCDAIVACSPDAAESLRLRYNLKAPAMVVPNAPALVVDQPFPIAPPALPIRVVVQAEAHMLAELFVVVEAWSRVSPKQALLSIVTNPAEAAVLREKYGAAVDSDSVHVLTGPQLAAVAKECDLGLVLGDASSDGPEPLAVYLQAGLAVVAPTGTRAGMTVTARGCGITVPHRNPVALAYAVTALADDMKAVARLRRRARALAEDTYHWDSVAAEFARKITELFSA